MKKGRKTKNNKTHRENKQYNNKMSDLNPKCQ